MGMVAAPAWHPLLKHKRISLDEVLRYPLVLVTHQVNISHITGEFTSMGEMLATRFADGRLKVLARLSV